MNATVLPSPTSLPGNITFGSNAVLPYGSQQSSNTSAGSTNQQTSNTSAGSTSQQTSDANTNQQTSNRANTSQRTYTYRCQAEFVLDLEWHLRFQCILLSKPNATTLLQPRIVSGNMKF